MKTMNVITTGDSKSKLPLHQLVDDILRTSAQESSENKKVIHNTIPDSLYVNANEEVITSVIEGLLDAVVSNATDGDIHVSAKELFGNTVKIFVKDNNCYNTYAVACSLQKMVPLAEQIGGFLNITNQRQKITTVEFSFPLMKEDETMEED
jgi:hypothetical protein